MRRAAKRYPPLPTSAEAPGGTVEIIFKREPFHFEGKECGGLWDAEHRTITLDAREPRKCQWKWYFHEMAHAALTDSGLCNVMTDDMQETLCDAFATARMRERFG